MPKRRNRTSRSQATDWYAAGARKIAPTSEKSRAAQWSKRLGLATIVSPWPWRRALTSWSGGKAMAASLAVVALGATLPLVQTSLPMTMLSALLFGGAFFIPPAIGTAVFRKGLPPAAWGKAVAGFTLVFAAGQTVGPVLTGALSDTTGSLFAGLALSVAIVAVAALVALAQKDVRTPDARLAA